MGDFRLLDSLGTHLLQQIVLVVYNYEQGELLVYINSFKAEM